jgi:hypothetical protein
MTQMLRSAALALAATATFSAALPASAASQFTAVRAAEVMNGSEAAWHQYDNRGRGHGWNSRGGNDNRGNYDEPVYSNTRTWRGEDGRTYCRRQNGTTGLLIGGVVGGVIGHEVAGRRGDRTLGSILGAAGGALLGRAIDRSGSSCR